MASEHKLREEISWIERYIDVLSHEKNAFEKIFEKFPFFKKAYNELTEQELNLLKRTVSLIHFVKILKGVSLHEEQRKVIGIVYGNFVKEVNEQLIECYNLRMDEGSMLMPNAKGIPAKLIDKLIYAKQNNFDKIIAKVKEYNIPWVEIELCKIFGDMLYNMDYIERYATEEHRKEIYAEYIKKLKIVYETSEYNKIFDEMIDILSKYVDFEKGMKLTFEKIDKYYKGITTFLEKFKKLEEEKKQEIEGIKAEKAKRRMKQKSTKEEERTKLLKEVIDLINQSKIEKITPLHNEKEVTEELIKNKSVGELEQIKFSLQSGLNKKNEEYFVRNGLVERIDELFIKMEESRIFVEIDILRELKNAILKKDLPLEFIRTKITGIELEHKQLCEKNEELLIWIEKGLALLEKKIFKISGRYKAELKKLKAKLPNTQKVTAEDIKNVKKVSSIDVERVYDDFKKMSEKIMRLAKIIEKYEDLAKKLRKPAYGSFAKVLHKPFKDYFLKNLVKMIEKEDFDRAGKQMDYVTLLFKYEQMLGKDACTALFMQVSNENYKSVNEKIESVIYDITQPQELKNLYEKIKKKRTEIYKLRDALGIEKSWPNSVIIANINQLFTLARSSLNNPRDVEGKEVIASIAQGRKFEAKNGHPYWFLCMRLNDFFKLKFKTEEMGFKLDLSDATRLKQYLELYDAINELEELETSLAEKGKDTLYKDVHGT